MIRTIKHEEYTYQGRRVILDTAEIYGEFETMLMLKPSGREIACKTASTEAQALQDFAEIRAKHLPDAERKPAAPKPLTGKYAKLRDDLIIALSCGRVAQRENPEDGGTCNFDSPSLYLPRWSSKLVEQAAKEASTRAFEWSCWGGKRWVFCPDSGAQANARSRNAEAMCAALKRMGYDAFMYCQAD